MQWRTHSISLFLYDLFNYVSLQPVHIAGWQNVLNIGTASFDNLSFGVADRHGSSDGAGIGPHLLLNQMVQVSGLI
jgi:hypothetical protein